MLLLLARWCVLVLFLEAFYLERGRPISLKKFASRDFETIQI